MVFRDPFPCSNGPNPPLDQPRSDCLRSTSAFAPYAMPSLVEKLGTSSGPAKRDSVEMISACAPVYGMAAVSPHIENIWELLKDDVEKAQDDSTEQKNALFCVKSILSTLSANPAQTSSNPLEKMLKMVVTDCLTHTKEPESKLARTGAKIIVACASSSGEGIWSIGSSTRPFPVTWSNPPCRHRLFLHHPNRDPRNHKIATRRNGPEAKETVPGNYWRLDRCGNTSLQIR